MTDQIFYTEGAGNSFFFTLSESLKFKDLLGVSKKEDIHPDGFIVSKRVDDRTISFDFYNNDGSNVDFCGNALRAVGLCYNKITGEDSVFLKTNVGRLLVEIKNPSMVQAEMPKPVDKGKVEVRESHVPYILSGVPHLVFERSMFSLATKEEMRSFCQNIRSMNLGGLETVNLTFYEKNTSPVECITFERGVEDFTKACGSGALSVAEVIGGDLVSLQMPGGALEVKKEAGRVYMLGPAKILDVF